MDDASDEWHRNPKSGLLADRRGSPTNDPTMVYSDGGISWFPDVGFPAHREQLYRSAVAHGAPPALLEEILRLPHVVGSVHELPNLYPHLPRPSRATTERTLPPPDGSL